MKIDVVMGGPGREADVSRSSGRAVFDALQRGGFDVALVDCAGELALQDLRPEALVFNIIHGTYGEDGTLQDELENAGRRYLGSDAKASHLCMDKAAVKAIADRSGVKTAWGGVIDPRNPGSVRDLRLPTLGPLVLKPRRDGSSVGLRFLASPSFLLPALEELVADLGPVEFLVEERLAGPEFTVAVIDDAPGDPRCQPPLCIRPASGVYDYEAKYLSDDTVYEAVEAGPLFEQLQRDALTMYQACGCRHLARVDFMLDAVGVPRLLEVNTLPGFTAHSLVPKAAALAGRPFDELCAHLMRLVIGVMS
jgi:D-alanine-D-alanine ligase